MEWTGEQRRVLAAVREFLARPGGGVFVLRGYAGTGKTTLVKEFLSLAEQARYGVRLLAPTGRAAKVLAEKTGHATSTIHRAIYKLDSIQEDSTTGEVCFYFPLRKLEEPARWLTIVDEASMVQSRPERSGRLVFGVNGLLPDLLDNANVHLGGKLIFIGDPAQLPPVGENVSAALDDEFFASRNISVTSDTLTEVMRQDRDSLILKNAMKLRELLQVERQRRNTLVMHRNGREFSEIESSRIVERYLALRTAGRLDAAAMICYSNVGALSLNRFVREQLFPAAKHIMPGDMVISTANSYNAAPGGDVLNGEFLTVTEVDNNVTTRTQKVMATQNGKKASVPVPIDYRNVTLRNAQGQIIKAMIVDNLLDSSEPTLTGEQTRSMYVDFKVRHSRLKENSAEFAMALRDDPFFNALKLKYGYALTCHKAQGGEWDNVLIDFIGRTGLDDDSLRWMYTALTRARHTIFGAHIPTIDVFTKLRFTPIERVTKARAGSRCLAPMPATPFHSADAPLHLKAKFWAIEANLHGTEFAIESVRSANYREIYNISTPAGSVRVDFIYSGEGIFKQPNMAATALDTDFQSRLRQLLADESRIAFAVDYKPSNAELLKLYQNLASACSEVGVTITAISEIPASYHVVYSLITDAEYACLDFYFNAKGQFTYAKAQSFDGDDDEKLKMIIQRFKLA